MRDNKNLELAEQFAADYDQVIKKNNWVASDILFGMLYEFLHSEMKILDVGTGTGLSSLNFKRGGCKIIGLDGALNMLQICKSKGLKNLVQTDISKNGFFPFIDNNFAIIVSVGVFHLIKDLDLIFNEFSRLIADKGIIAFTFDSSTNEKEPYHENKNSKSEAISWKHNPAYIEQLLLKNNFSIIKNTRFLAFQKTEWADEIYFTAYIAQKRNCNGC